MGGATLVTPEEKTQTVVRVARLSKHYRARAAVQNIDINVERGEIYGLIGPDGAGKSSLLKAVAGIEEIEAGSVDVFGVRLDSEAAAERIKPRIGFMPQGLGLNLYPELSVDENLEFFARLRQVRAQDFAERRRNLLAMTRLEDYRERPMKHLSGGMKQKLGLACTLVHAPELLILDEPTTGIDPVARRDFWGMLAQLQHSRQITVLVATAYMDEASRFHRLAMIHAGQRLAEGTPAAIRTSVPGSVIRLQTPQPAQALARLRARFPQVEAMGPWIRVFLPEAEQSAAIASARQALADTPVDQMQAEAPQLEDIFLALMRQQGHAHTTAPEQVYASAAPPLRASQAAVEALDLTRDFGDFRAVDKARLHIARGEIFGLLGANGAGKTTLIKMLTGILPPSAGACRVAGVDMRKPGRALRQRIGYVSQLFSLYSELSVMDNIRLYAGIYGLNRSTARERAQWAIDMGGLAAHRHERTGSLPVGLRQRLALGCALLHRPQVLFLDEPTSGVDPEGRHVLWDTLNTLARRDGVAILVTTHHMSEVTYCDQVALMHAGRIVTDGAPDDLRRRVQNEIGSIIDVETNRPMEVTQTLRRSGYAEAAIFGGHSRLLSRDVPNELPRLRALLDAAGYPAAAVSAHDLGMEDVFVHLILQQEMTGEIHTPGTEKTWTSAR